MKKTSKILATWLLIVIFLFNLIGCTIIPSNDKNETNSNQQTQNEDFYIVGESTINLNVGESVTLKVEKSDELTGEITWTTSSGCASVENGVVTALSEGTAVITAILGQYKDRVTVIVSGGEGNVIPDDSENNDDNKDDEEDDHIFGSEYSTITIAEALDLAEGYTSAASTEKYYIIAEIYIIYSTSTGEMSIQDDTGFIYVYKCTSEDGSSLSSSGIEEGDIAIIYGSLRNYKGLLEIERGQIIDYYTPGVETPTKPDTGDDKGDDPDNGGNDNGDDVIVPGTGDPVTSDPYVNVNKDEFYANYTPAISYMDAYYRTQHNLMSGSIASQDQAPTISANRPKSNGKYIRNNVYIFSDDGNTYYVVDYTGEVAFEVYRGGAYVTLEEVAAYVFAFGETPANHSASKSTKPSSSAWGIYLRVNNTNFSGDTYKYPYEPVLPRISGCGGDLTYYEMDIGTTGTDCDPSYTAALYNNGYSITRGAARIVYSCYDINGNKIIDLDERYVFYTYNHYNDFQEYLNYQGGWGEIFGNVTGGGTISSKYDYNPTDYVEVVRASLNQSAATVVVVYAYLPKEEYVA